MKEEELLSESSSSVPPPAAQPAPSAPTADLQQKNQEVMELLQERVSLFCELAEVTSGQEALQPPITRSLFRADGPQAPRAGRLLLDATAEGDL